MRMQVLYCFIVLLLATQSARAETDEDIAKAAQNPLGRNPKTKYYTLPFINNYNIGYGSKHRTQDILQFKPIIPFQVTATYDIVFRPILSLYHQPASSPQSGYINGWGDLNPTIFLTPTETREFAWGVGPNIFIPTATNTALGTGKWSLGPQIVLAYMPPQWLFAFLTSNVWSVAGAGNRPAVSEFSLQYFITYNFPHGWYLTTQPTITANWKASSSQQWTVPFGVGPGKILHIGSQAINLTMQGYWNAVHPSSTSSRWNLQLKMEFMFPTDNSKPR